jgi:TrmH family RNA methyltransferase
VTFTPRTPRVVAARRLQRRRDRDQTGRFLVEGPQAVREALAAGAVVELFGTPPALQRYADLAARSPMTSPVTDEALAALAETVQPQGLVAVCRFVDEPFPDLVAREPALLAVCAEVRDPGNAGTVIRCADAAGAGGVVLTGSSVDPYNGKAVRASAGSLFHLPVALEPSAELAVTALQDGGVTVLAADGAGEVDLDDAADDGLLSRRTAWLFGNEARGLPAELAALADHRVRIPIHGRAESLNLATAAAVCLYASARAQRHG